MKKFFLLGLIVCVVLVPGAVAWQRGSGAEVYQREGARLALEGRLEEAAKAFAQAAALDPTNGNAYYGLGNVYAEMGRWEDASHAYYKAVDLNKDDVEAYNNLGVALGMRGLHKQAAAAFERAVKIYPKWAEPYYHLGEARRALGQHDEAREAFDRALRLRPDYASRPPRPFAAARTKSAPAPRSRVLEAMNAVNLGAAGAEETAAAPSPSPVSTTPKTNLPAGASTPSAAPTARPATPPPAAAERATHPYDLGVSEARAGRHREAVAAFRQAVLLDRRNAAAYRALGDAYAALGDWRNSVDAYEQAARLEPDNADTYQMLGRAYAKLRETAGAAGEADGARTSATGTAASDDAATGARRPPTDDPDPTAVYRIGPGDVLDIRLLNGRERRTTAYEVTPTGLIDHPALKEPLAVAGLTVEEAAARLGAALGLRAGGADPQIAVGVRDYVSHAIIVGGMVKEGGTKILQREGVPLYAIIAHAQPLPGAGQALVFGRATGRTTAVDLSDAAAMKMLVRPGDVVTVRALPKQFVYVAGAVREPGQKDFHSGMTLTQVLLAAGGVLAPGNTAVAVTRQGDDGRLSTARYNLAEIKAGRAPDPPLRAGDRVEVLR